MSVLLDKRDFFSITADKILRINQLNQSISDDSSIIAKVKKFSIIDMDNDGVPEVVLWLSVNDVDYWGAVVLYYRDGIIYGHTLYIKQLLELKADGTFSYSGGTYNNGFGTADFSYDTWKVERIAFCESTADPANNQSLLLLYYINNESVTRDEFDAAIIKQSEKPDAKWHEFTDDNVKFIFERQFTYEFLISEEGIAIPAVSFEAAAAMIRADLTKLSSLVIDMDVLENTIPYLTDFYDELEFLEATWSPENIRLPSSGNIRLPIEIYASYEYLIKGDDSFGYVSMILVKIDDEWKVKEIYFEQ